MLGEGFFPDLASLWIGLILTYVVMRISGGFNE